MSDFQLLRVDSLSTYGTAVRWGKPELLGQGVEMEKMKCVLCVLEKKREYFLFKHAEKKGKINSFVAPVCC